MFPRHNYGTVHSKVEITAGIKKVDKNIDLTGNLLVWKLKLTLASAIFFSLQ